MKIMKSNNNGNGNDDDDNKNGLDYRIQGHLFTSHWIP